MITTKTLRAWLGAGVPVRKSAGDAVYSASATGRQKVWNNMFFPCPDLDRFGTRLRGKVYTNMFLSCPNLGRVPTPCFDNLDEHHANTCKKLTYTPCLILLVS